MKIAFITTQINIKTGGGSNISPHLKASAMNALGHETDIITLFPEKNSLVDKPVYHLIESPTRFKNWFALQIKIFFTLKKYERAYDAFAFEGEHFIWGAGLYRFLAGKTPILLHFNGPIFSIYEHGSTFNAAEPKRKSLKTKISDWLRNKFEGGIGLFFANHIDFFTADSPLIKEWHEKFGFDQKKISVLPAFVDLEQFFKNIEPMHKKDNDSISLLYVGRLVPEKGVDTLLSAIKEIKDARITADIVGRGSEDKKLAWLAKEYKIENRVRFHPWADKQTLNNMYHSADVFVHPARWAEPLGLTVIEAMAAGLPVIVPQISGSVWAAGDGGLAFKNGDFMDLKNKIEKLADNADLRKNMSDKAKNRSKQFDYRNSAKILEGILSGIINKNII